MPSGSLTKCMGFRTTPGMCETCKRLARSQHDEDSEKWMTPAIPCDKYNPVKVIEVRK
jgi:hypothetical protein